MALPASTRSTLSGRPSYTLVIPAGDSCGLHLPKEIAMRKAVLPISLTTLLLIIIILLLVL